MSLSDFRSPERTLRWIVRQHGRQGAVSFLNLIRSVAPTHQLADFLGESIHDTSDIRRTIELAIAYHLSVSDNQPLSSQLIDQILHPNRRTTLAV